MEKVIFTNSRGVSVELGGEAPYILTKVEGTGAVTATMQTEKSYKQDGVSYIDNTLEPRPLSIEVMLIAPNEEKMAEERERLARVFNPKMGEGKIIYKLGNIKREIWGIAEVAPTFPHAGDFQETMQPGMIQLYCPNPFWLDMDDTVEEIATWIGGMRFPLRLPTRFAMRGQLKRNIINKGDVEAPVTIKFKGPATNPKIINHTVGKYIQVNRTLTAEDVLVVTTHFGNKRVEINGQNVFNWINLESSFWMLQPGDNIIEYVNGDEVEPGSVVITYRNRYIGV